VLARERRIGGWLFSLQVAMGTADHLLLRQLLLAHHVGRILKIEEQRLLILKDLHGHASDTPAFRLLTQEPDDLVGVVLSVLAQIGPEAAHARSLLDHLSFAHSV